MASFPFSSSFPSSSSASSFPSSSSSSSFPSSSSASSFPSSSSASSFPSSSAGAAPAAEVISADMVYPLVQGFLIELVQVFPDIAGAAIGSWWNFDRRDDAQLMRLAEYCRPVLMPQYINILYHNDQIFDPYAAASTQYLPGVDFRDIWWAEGVSSSTREMLWKHLTVLVTVVMQIAPAGGASAGGAFGGDVDDVMQCMDPEVLTQKMHEIHDMMMHAFGGADGGGASSSSSTGMDDDDEDGGEELDEEDERLDNLLGKRGRKAALSKVFDPETIMNHIKGMMQGKLGSLASEFSREAMSEFGFPDEAPAGAAGSEAAQEQTKRVFDSILRQPHKLSEIIKRMHERLQHQLDTGEITKMELIEEGRDLLKKMHDVPGLDKMFTAMGMGGAGGAKLDKKAMEAALARKAKEQARIERMKARAAHNAHMRAFNAAGEAAAGAGADADGFAPMCTDEELEAIFSATSAPANPARRKKGGRR